MRPVSQSTAQFIITECTQLDAKAYVHEKANPFLARMLANTIKRDGHLPHHLRLSGLWRHRRLRRRGLRAALNGAFERAV